MGHLHSSISWQVGRTLVEMAVKSCQHLQWNQAKDSAPLLILLKKIYWSHSLLVRSIQSIKIRDLIMGHIKKVKRKLEPHEVFHVCRW